jgi:hypothetical protein
MSLRLEALFQVSFWLAFYGCSFELTNGGVPMLGFDSRGLLNSNRSREQMNNKCEIHGMVQKVVSTSFFRPLPPPPPQGARAGLFIVGDQKSYYNTLNTPNHLPHQ